MPKPGNYCNVQFNNSLIKGIPVEKHEILKYRRGQGKSWHFRISEGAGVAIINEMNMDYLMQSPCVRTKTDSPDILAIKALDSFKIPQIAAFRRLIEDGTSDFHIYALKSRCRL